MSFMQRLLEGIRDFVESLFASSSPEYKKKRQLRALAASLRAIEPPIYRQDGFLLPAFPATLYQINQFLSPLRDTLFSTIASADKRVADKTRDALFELAMSEEQRSARMSFTMQERLSAMVAQRATPERIIEDQGKLFSSFIKSLRAQTCSRRTPCSRR
jgi:hypothetical protein